MKPEYLSPESIQHFIAEALREDVGPGDYSTLSAVPPDAQRRARLLVKDNGVLAGVSLAYEIFQAVDPNLKMEVQIPDGQEVRKGDVAFYVSGSARSILTAERLALNCMQRMSGIATLTRQVVRSLEGTSTKVLDTRKTTPNFRLPEKWAVHIGGGVNHRYGLFDLIMLKDNHIDFAGGVREAIQGAKKFIAQENLDLRIEVETRNLEEVREVLEEGGVFRIMLDNFTPESLREAVAFIDGRTETEASGGITPENARAYAESGVDYLSMGALTHSHRNIDLSLKAV